MLCMEKCFSYSYSDVKFQPLLDIEIKCEYKKSSSDSNKKLLVFFLHRNNIYSWQKNQKRLTDVSESKSRHLTKLNHNEFLFRADYSQVSEEQEMEYFFSIKRIRIQFSTYKVMTIYEEKLQPSQIILAHALDYRCNFLYILYKGEKSKQMTNNWLKIIDLNKSRPLRTVALSDQDLIGRLISGLFNLVEGHFYFGNHVIKTRVRVIKKKLSQSISEQDVF